MVNLETSVRATAFEEDVSAALRTARELHVQYDAACKALAEQVSRALLAVVRPGMVLRRPTRDFGVVHVAAGNARGALAFEVQSAPVLTKVEPSRLGMTQFKVQAYPLNPQGKRMSGRAGNYSVRGDIDPDTVTLSVYLLPDPISEEAPSDEEYLLRLVRRAQTAGEDSALGGEDRG